MDVRIYLTGSVALEVDGAVVLGEQKFRGRQGRLLFAYLVCERTRPVPKGELAELLWPGEVPAAWEISLSALLSRIRKNLEPAVLGGHGVSLSSGFGQHRLVLPADVWVDLEAAASGIDRAESHLRAGQYGRILGPATVSATISRRPFLSDVEGDWLDTQRRKLDRQLVRALECLTKMRLASGEPALAVESATEAVNLDPFRESSYQDLMQAHVASGNNAEALRVYEGLRNLLAEELGTSPSAETQRLYQELAG